MTLPEDQIDADPTCSFLGLADDADSHATYATEAHRCYKLPNPTRIATGHQESYCLGANHPNCPVYQGEGVPTPGARAAGGAAPAGAAAAAPGGPPAAPPVAGPRGQRRPPQAQRRRQPGALGPRPRSGGISMPVATIGLFALAIALVALAFLIQRALSGGDDDPTPTDTFETQQASFQTQTAAAGGNGETTVPSETETPGSGETPGGEETTTTEPAETETPGSGGSGETYTVVSGDTCGALATPWDTTVEAIRQANDLDELCSLNVDQVLVIP